jgi:hypothetical protein
MLTLGEVVRNQALVIVPILDPTVPGGPGVRPLTVTATDPHVQAHLVQGWLVLTGRPKLAVPDLSATPATLHVTVRAAGLHTQQVTVQVPAGTTLPFTAPPTLLAVPSIAITGRVSAAAFPHGPVPDAQVRFGGSTPDGVLAAARTPLALEHAVGTPVREAVFAVAATTTLAAPAAAGSTAVHLSAAAGVAAGSVLALGADRVLEHVVVGAVAGTSVTLRSALVRSWPAAAPVARVTVTFGAATSLARSTAAGDGVLVCAAAPTTDAVQIADTVLQRVEHRVLGCLTDSDGRWRLSGVRGVSALEMTVAATGFTTSGPNPRALDPRRDPNVFDTDLTV